MKKRAVRRGLSALLVVAAALPLQGQSELPPPTRLGAFQLVRPQALHVWVDDSYGASIPGWQRIRFDRIQDGVDAVAPGGTVHVRAGTYVENVVIAATLTLEGASSAYCVINGGGVGDVVRSVAAGVTLQGFTIRNGGSSVYDAGVLVEAPFNTVRENAIEQCGSGILLDAGGINATVADNGFSQNVNAVRVHAGADASTISGNTVELDANGILLFDAGGHVVTGNTISTPGVGINVYQSSGNQIDSNGIVAGTVAIDLSFADGNTIEGNTISGAGAAGIRLYSSGFNLVDENQVAGVTTGIQVSFTSSPNSVTENQLSSNGRSILLQDAGQQTVTDNVVTGTGGLAILNHLGQQIWTWNTHTIEGNVADGRPIRFYKDVVGPLVVPANTAQVLLANCTDVTVQGLQIDGMAVGVQVGHCSDVQVLQSTVANAFDVAIDVALGQDVTIADNVLTDSGYAVRLEGAGHEVLRNEIRGGLWGISLENPVFEAGFPDQARIVENRIEGCSRSGIILGASDDNVVEDNHLSFVTYPNGALYVYESDGNLLARNVVTGSMIGIGLQFSDSNELRSNLLSANTSAGLFLGGRFNQVLDNVVLSNPIGIDDAATLNTLSGNNLGDNALGIDMGGNVSQVHHNDLRNAQNAFGPNSFMDWDDGYPSGGNYWSDYVGLDDDRDGIGDTPYVVSGAGAVDRYPLMDLSGDAFLWGDVYSVSVATGGTVQLELDAGAVRAGRDYLLLGSQTGIHPGTPLPGGAILPLVWDAFTDDVLANANGPVYVDFAGTLDGNGRATAQLVLPTQPAQLAGTTLYFAFALSGPYDFASVPVNTELVD